MSTTKKHRQTPQRRARPPGWFTSDADEIERRRLRGVNEPMRIESQTPDDVFFGVYRTHSGSGQRYCVEIRSLAEPINSCNCPDHHINGLGKTVQAVAACELLRRILDIRRVLVISPASLKGEWAEQIAKFTDLPAHIIQGLSLIHISEPTRQESRSRMPSSA